MLRLVGGGDLFHRSFLGTGALAIALGGAHAPAHASDAVVIKLQGRIQPACGLAIESSTGEGADLNQLGPWACIKPASWRQLRDRVKVAVISGGGREPPCGFGRVGSGNAALMGLRHEARNPFSVSLRHESAYRVDLIRHAE